MYFQVVLAGVVEAAVVAEGFKVVAVVEAEEASTGPAMVEVVTTLVETSNLMATSTLEVAEAATINMAKVVLVVQRVRFVRSVAGL